MDVIWSNAFLAKLQADAPGQINTDLNCIWTRECIAITQGQSVVTLPAYVRTLMRIVWRGKTLEPVNWVDLTLLSPGTVNMGTVGDPNNIETSLSRPMWYAMHPTNPWDVRFYPSPDESFTLGGEPDVFSPQVNTPSCIIEHWREPDQIQVLFSIPSYIMRRTAKAYVLWKAFAAEGRGQNLKASAYYEKKYNFLIDQFRNINDSCYVSKRYELGTGLDTVENYKYPKPKMPTNFENYRFR